MPVGGAPAGRLKTAGTFQGGQAIELPVHAAGQPRGFFGGHILELGLARAKYSGVGSSPKITVPAVEQLRNVVVRQAVHLQTACELAVAEAKQPPAQSPDPNRAVRVR